MKVVISQGQTF